MCIKRTFHPVGQGAFYSEDIVFDNGESYCVVYDCGSTSKGVSLGGYITNTFERGKIIDILFISHLHADHINGIDALKRHCHIRSVVMPFIKEQDKIMLKFANLQNVNRQQAGDLDFDMLIDDPVRFFNDTRGERTRIIRVATTSPVDPDNDQREGKELKKYNDRSLDDILKYNRYETSRLYPDQKLTLANGKWIYILINHREEQRIKEFKKALKGVEIIPSDDPVDFFEKNKKALTKAYNAVEGDLNSNSLIVYSGCTNNCKRKSSGFGRPKSIIDVIQCNKEACLYTGDANLQDNGLIDQIESSLSCCKEKIHIIQVPHHGSEHNWDSRIMNLNPKCDDYVISHGTGPLSKKYGHPADSVLSALESNGKNKIQVTEGPASKHTQNLN